MPMDELRDPTAMWRKRAGKVQPEDDSCATVVEEDSEYPPVDSTQMVNPADLGRRLEGASVRAQRLRRRGGVRREAVRIPSTASRTTSADGESTATGSVEAEPWQATAGSSRSNRSGLAEAGPTTSTMRSRLRLSWSGLAFGGFDLVDHERGACSVHAHARGMRICLWICLHPQALFKIKRSLST